MILCVGNYKNICFWIHEGPWFLAYFFRKRKSKPLPLIIRVCLKKNAENTFLTVKQFFLERGGLFRNYGTLFKKNK